MINVHQKLTEAFETLPLISGFKPNYKWGNELHLNKLIKLYEKDSKTPYPIIYNVSNSNTQDVQKVEAVCKLSLVLATRDVNKDYHNSQRWATSYNNILFPLAQSIEQLFKKGSIFLWDKKYTLYEFPNYGNTKENATTDIIDALRFDTTITINNNCLNEIFYDTN